MQRKKYLQGFTLVEMILYVALCSMLLLVLSTLLSFLLSSRVQSQSITEVNQQGLQVMNLISSTIRNGKSIETPEIGVSSSTLSLTTGDPLLNPSVFRLASTTLIIQEGGKTPIPLTNSRVSVSELMFQNISSASTTERIIRTTFTVTYVNVNGKQEYTYSKTFTQSATLRQ